MEMNSDNIIIGASSHYCTAERQFRMPLEHGNQRPPSAQWTATAAGAMVLSCGSEKEASLIADEEGNTRQAKEVQVTFGTIGKVIDAGIKDANQMGAAMAPAAVDTILTHLEETGRTLDHYDLVCTGDLGFIGKSIVRDLLEDAGVKSKNDRGCI